MNYEQNKVIYERNANAFALVVLRKLRKIGIIQSIDMHSIERLIDESLLTYGDPKRMRQLKINRDRSKGHEIINNDYM